MGAILVHDTMEMAELRFELRALYSSHWLHFVFLYWDIQPLRRSKLPLLTICSWMRTEEYTLIAAEQEVLQYT